MTTLVAATAIIGTQPIEYLRLDAALDQLITHLAPEAPLNLVEHAKGSGQVGVDLETQLVGAVNGNYGLMVDLAGNPDLDARTPTEIAARALLSRLAEVGRACMAEPEPGWDAIESTLPKVHTAALDLREAIAPDVQRFQEADHVQTVVGVDQPSLQHMWFFPAGREIVF